LLLGDGVSGTEGAQSWTARALAMPAGEWLVAALGIAVIVGAVEQMREAKNEKFLHKLRMQEMSPRTREWARRSGRWGYAARGIVFAIMGGFLVYAAWKSDPSEARGLEGVLDGIAAQTHGQWLLGGVAAGLALYGIYCFVQAQYRRVQI
jgi:hypothetical protein